MAEETETSQETKEEEKKEEPRALSQEDINKLIEGARKQEKDKLYETITSLRDKVDQLAEDKKKEQQEKERIEREAVERADQERLSKLTAEQQVAEKLKNFEERLAKEAQQRERLESELEDERKKAELERYRAELLVNEKDIIPELVSGTTREEIANSVQTAKARYQSLFDQALEKAKGEGGKAGERLGLPGPANPDPDPLDEEDLKGLRGLNRPDMTTGSMKSRAEIIAAKNKGVSEEYLKHKDELLNKVGELYRKSVRG